MDCTDNLATRYLLNDACAAVGPIPLVSGSALRFDGQMTVYLTRRVPDHDAGEDGEAKRRKLADEERVPCFRCLHPTPPPAVQGCSDAGVLGVGKYACPNHGFLACGRHLANTTTKQFDPTLPLAIVSFLTLNPHSC